MSIVTRFPPSPTGHMHIGTARTALFNWLYARKHGGKMLFRIEDTDRARHNEEAVTALINAMRWLELDWDGDIVSQYENRDRHAEIAHQLLNKGKAYKCYCSAEELEAMRSKARTEGRSVVYDRRWRDKDASEAPQDVEPVIRIKAPLEGTHTIRDAVQGEVSVAAKDLDDFIILRADGTPTYMLSVVVDDHDMGVTHVIRGDDHLNNTFRQNILYEALGWEKPKYAHIPLILGPDGSKMSKRHGAASVEEYRKMGYLPEALCNYLLRLGWSHGDAEIISRDQALEWFDLDHVGKSAARFDFDKLESINAHYLNEIDNDRLLDLAAPFYEERHAVQADDAGLKRVSQAIDELKSRAKTLLQLVDESVFFLCAPDHYTEQAQTQFDTNGIAALGALHSGLAQLDGDDADAIKDLAMAVAKEQAGGKLGKIGMPLRAAVTGTTQSPSIFDACAILGIDETRARIGAALEKFGNNAEPSERDALQKKSAP